MKDLREQIQSILFEIGVESKLHKVDKDNFILEVDYEKYTEEILALITEYQRNYPGHSS